MRIHALKDPLLVSALLMAVMSTGCHSLPVVQSGAGQASLGVIEIPAEQRLAPVEVSGTSLTGDPVNSVDYRGKPVVINVWWSQCGPCIVEAPILDQVAAEGSTPFIGIDIRDASPSNGAAFQRANGVDYPSIYDPSSSVVEALGRYAPQYPPSIVVLDRQGRVAAVISGTVPSVQTLRDVIADADAAS